MSIFLKSNNTRTNINVSKKEIAFSVLFSLIFGFILGFVAKILDSPIIPNEISILSFIGSNWGIWIFISTLVAVYSYTPKLAATRVFIFLISMLFSYYIYSILVLGLFPLKYIIFWCIVALLSTLPAYILWFSHADNFISSILIALPISVISFDGYKIYLSTVEYYEKFRQYEDIMVSDGDYFYMLGTEITYSLLIIIILFLVPKRRKQCLYIIPFSIIVFSALVAIII
ncbi:hypothetical protein DCE79_10010 [Lysinibacillus sp. 2017]|uniref:DUF6518 family protein n=1 Tax=unclassified Lysinibacillus TaxID=2636778 RepID=UPI000D525D51|nr:MULTISPECIES: hypothetical protein [unclassified Lysinibacillus]AWE07696.1 hypothetical protein DCE79_10010 [Lysinibacillus sp. 2017]TGN36857.1 hypothetical protein E4L99_04705 [Lysinibacillus sp. S2017]